MVCVGLSLILFVAFAFQLVYHAVRAGVTLDEPPHILAGHRHLQCADFGINPEHPPLLKLLSAVPLAFRAPSLGGVSDVTAVAIGAVIGLALGGLRKSGSGP